MGGLTPMSFFCDFPVSPRFPHLQNFSGFCVFVQEFDLYLAIKTNGCLRRKGKPIFFTR